MFFQKQNFKFKPKTVFLQFIILATVIPVKCTKFFIKSALTHAMFGFAFNFAATALLQM